MNPLELRKIMVVGYRVGAPDGAPLLDHQGLPVKEQDQAAVLRVVFWIPQHGRLQRCDGSSECIDVRPHEREALRAGVIVEHVQEFPFDKMPGTDEMRRRLMPVWEGLAKAALGEVPNGAPIDRVTKPALGFELRSVRDGEVVERTGGVLVGV